MKLGFKKKEELEPVQGLIGEAVDYRIYEMTMRDRVMGFLIAFGITAVVVFTFFRGIIFTVVMGIIAGVVFQGPYKDHLCTKRRKRLLNNFRSMLESLATSYSAGKNTQGAFEDAYSDLEVIYGEDEDIVREAAIIVAGMQNNINIEELLRNFADRSNLDDISSFADVFEVSFRQGANINNIIGATRDIIVDKISVEMDIQTAVAGGKNELNIMMVMPLVVFLGLNGMGSEMTIIENTPLNVVIKLAAIGVFIAAYVIGRKIVDIKI